MSTLKQHRKLASKVLRVAYWDYISGGKHKQDAYDFFMGEELDFWCSYFVTLKPETIRRHIRELEG